MQRGGRPKHSYWEEGGFKSTRQNNKQVALCLQCNKIINNTAEQRLKSHRNSCKWENKNSSIDSSDDSLILHSSKKRKERSGSCDTNNNRSICDNEGITTQSVVKLKNKSKINTFLDKVSDIEQVKLDEALSNFFFSTNLPFSLVEDKYFIKFCKTLRPAYHIPSETDLSTRLLNDAYKRFTSNQVNINDEKAILLFCKNMNCKISLEIIGIINAGSSTLFIKSWRLKDEDEYLQKYSEMIEESSSIILKKYNVLIYTVISFTSIPKIDNTCNSTSKLTETDKSTVIWHLTCHLEIVDTLITSLHDDVLEIKMNRLLKQFESTSVQKEMVKRSGDGQSQLEQGVELSYHSKLSICLNNLPVIRQIVGDGLGIFDQDSVMVIFDKSFETNLKEGVFIFDFLTNFESNSSEKKFSIADSVEKWFELKSFIKNNEYIGIIDYVLKKIITPQALAANFLHPSYKGEAFMKINNYSHMVYEFLIDELDSEGLQELEHYKNSHGLFAKLFAKTTCPKTFWSIASEEFTKISILAQSLLKIPACTYRFNQGDLGNNLPNELMSKFINVFYSLEFMNIN